MRAATYISNTQTRTHDCVSILLSDPSGLPGKVWVRVDKKLLSALAVLTASFGFLYRDVLAKLVHDWAADGNYSHGFLIVPLVLYLAYSRREELRSETREPSNLGLVVVLLSLGLLVAGTLGAENFTTQVSILGAISGSLIYLCGWGHLRIMKFPI